MTAEIAVTFPDVEAILADYLQPLLPGVVIGIMKPTNMVGKQVLVLRLDGGPQLDRVVRADTITCRAFAPDEAGATRLAARAQMLMYALGDAPGYPVTHVEILSGSTAIVDDSLIPCRFFTAEVYVRGS